MSASAPGRSGAIVISRRPSSSGSMSAGSVSAGSTSIAGSWAPRFASARNGPSRLNPSGAAPSSGATGIQRRTRSVKACSVGSGADTPDGRNEVTP